MKRHEISEKQWNRIKSLFPPERKAQGGRPGKSNRDMPNAILYWLNAGFHGGICQSDSDRGKVYTAGFEHGQKLVYGNESL